MRVHFDREKNNMNAIGNTEALALRGQTRTADVVEAPACLVGICANVDRAERIRDTALMGGAKLLLQVEASRGNAENTGQIAEYRRVHEAMIEHMTHLRTEASADWWIAHNCEYADARCWRDTLRDLLATRDGLESTVLA